ncbi:MAG TPA: carboxypeptidase-like regulatory domain-containing protein, partial [Draconibacterium sp.]|nr:carboxypeptidase-like regulatory domain-containing protein [Draconibacterium sp.]
MTILKYIFVFIFVINSIILFAQKGIVSGHISDIETDQPLEYASVAVYNASDSLLIDGTITENTGIFKIEKLKDGAYFIRVQFLGYETVQTESFSVSNGRETKVGDIKVKPSAQLMEEISISGNRANASNQLEKQIYSSEQF